MKEEHIFVLFYMNGSEGINKIPNSYSIQLTIVLMMIFLLILIKCEQLTENNRKFMKLNCLDYYIFGTENDKAK